MKPTHELKRGVYGEIRQDSISPRTRKEVNNLFKAAESSVDEHGGWNIGAAFDSKGRGSAINWDLYGFGKDLHTRKTLAIVQIREYTKTKKTWWPQIRKNYFLIGRNEDGTAFAHPVQSQVIHGAIKKGKDVLHAVQSWMFGCDYKKVVRQGDVALVPVSRFRATPVIEIEVVVAENHHITAEEIRENRDYIYVKNPKSVHPTHPPIEAEGWFKVMVGRRARYWRFARPTKD